MLLSIWTRDIGLPWMIWWRDRDGASFMWLQVLLVDGNALTWLITLPGGRLLVGV